MILRTLNVGAPTARFDSSTTSLITFQNFHQMGKHSFAAGFWFGFRLEDALLKGFLEIAARF